jgi:hypothetical protein
MNGKTLMLVLWPSFLVAAAAETLFFTFFDPTELSMFGEPLSSSRTAIYSIGFLLFWLLGAASSAMTCFLRDTPDGRVPSSR